LSLQRSPAKITFPEIWANTCCSHPLFVRSHAYLVSYNYRSVVVIVQVEKELIEQDALGVKNAVRT
jgi:isopentenyldiphosphate isomerase